MDSNVTKLIGFLCVTVVLMLLVILVAKPVVAPGYVVDDSDSKERARLASTLTRKTRIPLVGKGYNLGGLGRKQPPAEPLETAGTDEGTIPATRLSQGTLCVYQGSSCDEAKEGQIGSFHGCKEEAEDNVCMNFPTAGIVFTCAANEKVNVYDTPGCAASSVVAEEVTCVDMTLGTYFLLCCSSEKGSGELCVAPWMKGNANAAIS